MGILSGIKIIEIEGLGPGPFCGMLLADLGADVVVISRNGQGDKPDGNIVRRGKRVIEANLKDENDREKTLDLIANADGLIEGMRPGVMERLGLSPEICMARNPKLAFGRMTGWGQSGALAQSAGHDLNYVAVSGALWYAGHKGEAPFVPPTMVGDIGGGALYLAIGLLSAILNAKQTGKGDVVDAAIVDGSAHMMNLLLTATAQGIMQEQRGISALDGAPFYETYLCADDRHITIGALEPQFYMLFVQKMGLADDPLFGQFDLANWEKAKIKLAAIFVEKPAQHWVDLMEGTDVCFGIVNAPSQAATHPHMQDRNVYYKDEGGYLQAAPAPRFMNADVDQQPTHGIGVTMDQITEDWL